ncbi:MAG: MATE family efflux transporter [Lachnospiraceae bacterium]|nr:MATE family efflux transporter [Lachnospiraceae bacterium]MDD7326477.1 MATE family efflux transporter [Lachnospiraceae bacterium]MDY2759255.1 MATE family efflux transporter [Lachnospiraceae bacterium]
MQENKMGVMPVKKLIVNMSVPMMISMLVQALYNVVDSVFVAMLSENALTAVTLAFPLQNLMIAVGAGTGVGVNAMLSRALGEKKYERSDKAANTAILLAIMSTIVFLILGLTITKPFINTQTTDPEIRQLGYTYLGIVMTIGIGIFMQVTFERLLQSTGRTNLSMISQMTGAIFNIIFDPILIFGLGPFPKMGVAGAAYATVCGQCVAACLGLYLNLRHNHELHFSLKKVLHPEAKIIGKIYAVGVPSILMMAIGSVMTYCMNMILKAFSSTAIAVFGAYFKLQSFFFMPVFGLNNGLIPVLAYNLGARKKSRIDEALKFALELAVCIMLCGTIVLEIFPTQLLSLFSPSKDMLRMGIPALRTIAIHFPIAACGIIMSSIFQAFSRSIYSLFVSLGRQLVILIPVAWLLAQTGNVNNVWWCYPIAEVVSFILSLIFFKKVYREEVKTLDLH